MRYDFLIHNEGSTVGFEPLNEAAQAWLDEHVFAEPWQFLGRTLWVDHRSARSLADGMHRHGLNLEE